MTWRRRSIGTGTTRPAARRARSRGPRLAVTSPGQRAGTNGGNHDRLPCQLLQQLLGQPHPGHGRPADDDGAAAVGRQTGQVLRSGETEVDDGQRRAVADRRDRPAAGCHVGGAAVDGDAGAQAAPPRAGDVGAQLLRGRGDEPGPEGVGSVHEVHPPAVSCRGVTDRQRHRGGTGAGVRGQDPYPAGLQLSAVTPPCLVPAALSPPRAGPPLRCHPSLEPVCLPSPFSDVARSGPARSRRQAAGVPVLGALRRCADPCRDRSWASGLQLS